MNLIVCVDEDGGVMFNHRRQSQDRVLRQKILELTAGKTLWMSAYSARQFAPEETETFRIEENFLEQAAAGDYCFLEGQSAAAYADRVEGVILFHWNRAYPSDVRFDLPLDGWKVTEQTDFAGSSHEKITMEVYIK